ncbi:MAG: trypsin-like serine protease [Gemmataceae bacterium]
MAVPATSRWSAQPARRSVRYAKPAIEALETRITPVLNPAGGFNPAPASFVPAVAQISGPNVFTGKTVQGTGTLIAPQWVLTAAHVISSVWDSDLRIDITGRQYRAAECFAVIDLVYVRNVRVTLKSAPCGSPGSPCPASSRSRSTARASSVGERVTLVGYGRTDNGTFVEQRDTGGVKRAGVGQIDAVPLG